MFLNVRLKRELGSRTVSFQVDETKESLADLRKKLYSFISNDYRFSIDAINSIRNEKCPLEELGIMEGGISLLCLIPPSFEPKLQVGPGGFDFPTETTPTKTPSAETASTRTATTKPALESLQKPSSLILPQGVLSTSNYGNFLRQNSSEAKVGRARSDVGGARSDSGMSFLCEALHMMMLDSGFGNKGCSEQEVSDSVNRYHYIAPIGPMIPIEMICTSLGPQLVTHASIDLPNDHSKQVVTCVLPMDQYVTANFTTATTTPPPAANTSDSLSDTDSISLTNTSQLTQTFKDAVPHHLLTDLRRALGLPEYGTILCLSHELKILIMSLLDLRALMSLSRVNREFNILSQDEYLWRLIFVRDFKEDLLKIPENEEVNSWKKHYQTEYVIKKTRQEQFIGEVLYGRGLELVHPVPPFQAPPILHLPTSLFGYRQRFNPYNVMGPNRRGLGDDPFSDDYTLPHPFLRDPPY